MYVCVYVYFIRFFYYLEFAFQHFFIQVCLELYFLFIF